MSSYIDMSREERRVLGARYVQRMQAIARADGWRFTPEGITRA